MCPVMRGFEEIGCFFYKGLLKGLGWGRENWRSLGTWNRREKFEVTRCCFFLVDQHVDTFCYSFRNQTWLEHPFSSMMFSFKQHGKTFFGFPRQPPLMTATKTHVWFLLSPFSITLWLFNIAMENCQSIDDFPS